jgi:hypothetical protein
VVKLPEQTPSRSSRLRPFKPAGTSYSPWPIVPCTQQHHPLSGSSMRRRGSGPPHLPPTRSRRRVTRRMPGPQSSLLTFWEDPVSDQTVGLVLLTITDSLSVVLILVDLIILESPELTCIFFQMSAFKSLISKFPQPMVSKSPPVSIGLPKMTRRTNRNFYPCTYPSTGAVTISETWRQKIRIVARSR